MAKTIMIQGTQSDAGKSAITAALCRIFTNKGYRVAPFKAQNMASDSFVSKEGYEISIAQAMQAEACRIEPDYRMNPVLLKPTNDSSSIVVLKGKYYQTMSGTDYYKEKNDFFPMILDCFESLSKENDIIIVEGAGSPAEINLKENDIVNMGLARAINAPVFIAGDIDRGGVFAAFAGTLQLLDKAEQDLVKGFIINKFRGDISILKPGLAMFEEKINKKIIGVVPYLDLDIDCEDSLSLKKYREEGLLNIGVLKLPHIANKRDIDVFNYSPYVKLQYLDRKVSNLDMLIIPHTNHPIADMDWLERKGLGHVIKEMIQKNKPIFALGNGQSFLYDQWGDQKGFVVFSGKYEKNLGEENSYIEDDCNPVGGVFSSLSGKKMIGFTFGKEEKPYLIQKNNTYGTAIHGLFDRDEIREIIVQGLLEAKGIPYDKNAMEGYKAYREKEYEKLAYGVENNIDMETIEQFLI